MRDNLVDEGFDVVPEHNFGAFELRGRNDEKDDVYRQESKTQQRRRVAAEKREAERAGCLDAAFAAASLLRSSDYTYLKSLRFPMIPKRKSFHVNVESLPSNAKYFAPEEDDDGT